MTIVKNDKASTRRGRPPAFDREEVLAKATEIFRRLGYEGASIADLTTAMGITPQSLYAAFSSKADLYREALAWYQAGVGALTARSLEEKDAMAALSRLLRESARAFTKRGGARGCMISTAMLTCATENEPLARHVSGLRERTLKMIKARIERGLADGQLRAKTDPEALARFVGAIVQGMSVQARDGASGKALMAVAEHAISEIERHKPQK